MRKKKITHARRWDKGICLSSGEYENSSIILISIDGEGGSKDEVVSEGEETMIILSDNEGERGDEVEIGGGEEKDLDEMINEQITPIISYDFFVTINNIVLATQNEYSIIFNDSEGPPSKRRHFYYIC